ncbi:uncharacterized protein LOC106012611 [Aplysia californica]|uniref:Uncharacterized protein LOC106012611 n=1 Tax=Aplysia californica TaxID=6500 RepID=A0ABM1A611_APLCA|nr:uncharacterized protein LOC106012611 [Aplysia californica]
MPQMTNRRLVSQMTATPVGKGSVYTSMLKSCALNMARVAKINSSEDQRLQKVTKVLEKDVNYSHWRSTQEMDKTRQSLRRLHAFQEVLRDEYPAKNFVKPNKRQTNSDGVWCSIKDSRSDQASLRSIDMRSGAADGDDYSQRASITESNVPLYSLTVKQKASEQIPKEDQMRSADTVKRTQKGLERSLKGKQKTYKYGSAVMCEKSKHDLRGTLKASEPVLNEECRTSGNAMRKKQTPQRTLSGQLNKNQSDLTDNNVVDVRRPTKGTDQTLLNRQSRSTARVRFLDETPENALSNTPLTSRTTKSISIGDHSKQEKSTIIKFTPTDVDTSNAVKDNAATKTCRKDGEKQNIHPNIIRVKSDKFQPTRVTRHTDVTSTHHEPMTSPQSKDKESDKSSSGEGSDTYCSDSCKGNKKNNNILPAYVYSMGFSDARIRELEGKRLVRKEKVIQKIYSRGFDMKTLRAEIERKLRSGDPVRLRRLETQRLLGQSRETAERAIACSKANFSEESKTPPKDMTSFHTTADLEAEDLKKSEIISSHKL